jgi:hypothetical protein
MPSSLYMENFCFSVLNRSSRFKDKTKVPTLGPWAAALFQIITYTQKKRTDIDITKYNKNCDLYRGGGMTLAEIKDYKDNTGKWITLFGYTSCSLKKNTAMSFMWENASSGHQKVLFHINWNRSGWHYFLNAGAYDHEEEVLLMDGTPIDVTSVEEISDDKGKFLYTLISLKMDY